jgi:hypothetical protein
MIDHRILRDGEGADPSVVAARDDGGHGRGDDQRGEGRDLVGTEQNDFRREENAGDGGVEHAGNTSGAAGGDVDFHPAARDLGELADLRAHGAADLGDRPLHSCGVAGADGQGRGDNLQDDGPGPDNAVFQVDLAQEFGEAVAVDLSGKEQRERDQQDGPAQRDEGQEEDVPAALGNSEQFAAAHEEDPVHQIHQAAEEDVQQSCGKADKGGRGRHAGIFTRQESLQVFSHFFSGMVQPMAAA